MFVVSFVSLFVCSFVPSGVIKFALASYYANCPHLTHYNESVHGREEHAT